jgi:hypothetical protein
MNSEKLKQKKKKDRERAAKAKVLAKREVIRKERKTAIQDYAKEKEAHEIVHGKQMPIITNPQKLAEREALHAKEVAEKLKKNLEILEALEKEYEEEESRRAAMNESLEAEGHKTMREKMDALHKKALEMTGKAEEYAKAFENSDEEIVVNPENIVV